LSIKKELTSYKVILPYIEQWKIESKTLPISDVQDYLNFLSVLKHSAKFWDANEENGIKYLSWLDFSDDNNTILGFSMWKVLGADCCGAAFGSILGGPAGAAVGMAGSSCGSVIGQL
jgi:hypothetical protein